MKFFIKILCIMSMVVFNAQYFPSFASNNCISNHDIEPLAEDIYFLELINRARANPEAEAQIYNIELNEGVNSSSTISSTPKQPLAFNLNLYKAALAHSEDMLLKDYFSHYTYPTDESPQQRVVAQSYNYYSGENIAINMSTATLFINQNTAAYHHEILFVDEGYPNRGHRVNMLNSSHAEAGVAFAHGDYEDWPNAVVSTSDFGIGEKHAYICGVIYDDKNGNNFYDVGEGIPYATISIAETGDSVDAFSAGAYSLGVSSPGTFTVEAYLCQYNTSITKTVAVGFDNVKLDFLLSDFDYVDKPSDPNDSSDDPTCKSLSLSEVIAPNTLDEFANMPIKVNSGSDTPTFPLFNKTSYINMEIAFPCYTQLIDTYIALVFPDGSLYFISNEGKLTLEFAPFSISSSDSKNISLKISSLSKGDYVIYWASVPANGGDLLSVNWGDYCELGYFMHSIE